MESSRKICENEGCGKSFKPYREWQRFCCPKCTTEYHIKRTRKARHLLEEKEDIEETRMEK